MHAYGSSASKGAVVLIFDTPYFSRVKHVLERPLRVQHMSKQTNNTAIEPQSQLLQQLQI